MGSGMEAQLKCGICLEIFTDPYSLPCMHKFCKECIEGHLDRASSAACPLCANPTWRRQLAPDHTLAGVVNVYKASQQGGCSGGGGGSGAGSGSAAPVPAAVAASSGGGETWLESGHVWLGQRLRRFFDRDSVGDQVSDARCVKWLPADAANDEPALWHVQHDDGDEEDLEEHEMREAIAAHAAKRRFSMEWKVGGHPWIRERVRRYFHGHAVDATVERWLPKAAGRPSFRRR